MTPNLASQYLLIKYAYWNPHPLDVKDYYVGLTFNLFQIFPNPLREFIFNDITRSNPYDRLILVCRRGR